MRTRVRASDLNARNSGPQTGISVVPWAVIVLSPAVMKSRTAHS